MIGKKEAFRYVLVGGVLIILVGIMFFLRGGMTGFVIFEDNEQGEFDLGTYVNTTHNGSSVILSESNISGIYISQIFDVGNDAIWNNISWSSATPDLESLYCVDGGGEVFKSGDFGVNWIMTKENYGRTTSSADMFSDDSYIYVLASSNKEVWKSSDGETWGVVNDTFTTSSLLVGAADSSNNLYIATGPGDVYKSTDTGVTWSLLSDFNDGTQNAKGIAINSSDDIFIVDGTGDVYSSVDGGSSWTKVNDGYGGSTGTDGLEVDSNNNLYILIGSDVYKSINAGVTWDKINDDFSPYSNHGVEIGIDSNDNLYIADGIGRIFRSINSGQDWSEIGDCNDVVSKNPKGFTTFIESSNLDFQVKSCNDDICSGESFVNISGESPQDLSLSNNRYFQYQVIFASPDSSITPSLESVSIDYTLVNTAPLINLESPQDGANYGYNESLPLNFSVSDADDNLDKCWYNFGGENIILVDCVNITIDIAEGSHILNIYANDSLGLSASDSASFSVAVGAPTIMVHSPIDVYFSSGENIQFNYTPTDIDLDYCELFGDFEGEFKLNQTDNSPTSGEVNNFDLDLSDGIYLWNIRCIDNQLNSAVNGNKTFYVDSANPVISVSEPTGTKATRTVSASWSVSDSSPVSCIYSVYQGASLEVSNTSVNCSDNLVSFDVSTDADFIFNFYVNDSAGNSNSANSSFSVDTSVPASTPSGGGSGGGGGGGIINTNVTVKLTLQTSDLGNIIAYEGDKKTLSLSIKNIGSRFFNKCRLVGKGEIESWIYSTQIEGIAPGQNVDFIFDLNIPDEIESGDYKGDLEIKCSEGSDSQEIIISIPSLEIINVNEIIQEGNLVKISYNFDNSYVIGDSASVDIWIEDSEGYEIERVQDVFNIAKEGLIKRNVEIEFDGSGIYYIYFSISGDLENFVKESVVLGEAVGTGFAIFDTTKGKITTYVIFLIIIGIGIFIILRGHKKGHSKIHKSKHHWLFRRKS